MRYTTVTSPHRADHLVVVADDAAATDLPEAVGREAQRRLESAAVAVVPALDHLPQPAVVMAQAPDWADLAAVRRRGGAVGRALVADRAGGASVVVPGDLEDAARDAFLLGLGQGAYVWDQYRSEGGHRLARVRVVGAPRAACRRLEARLAAITLARDLVNTPAEDLGPGEFVSAARAACRDSGLTLRVLDEAACRKHRMGLLTTVGRASPRRPRLLVVEYPGTGQRPGKPLALCGKGVCFDTGGLDLKPATGMELMRKDMGGAASVLGAMLAIAAAGPKRPVRAYLPLVDNAVDGNAFRPGDILRAMDGTTVEIGNTDAEGRLVLADAICLAKREGARAVVTVATLTGAALVALGRVRVPIMGSDDDLLGGLEGAAEGCGERVWRLPFDDDYHQMLRSPNADVSNVGGREAGCITAGCFLARFAGDTPFAHADISPASWMTADHDLGPQGATGVFVTTLADFACG